MSESDSTPATAACGDERCSPNAIPHIHGTGTVNTATVTFDQGTTMPDTPPTAAACCGRIEHAVELVMRKHLPVQPDENGPVLCLCDVTQTYDGPVSQRRHVAVELRKAGLLRG